MGTHNAMLKPVWRKRKQKTVYQRGARVIAEALENRQLFSPLMVNTLSDATNPGAGLLTLRQAVAEANAQPGSTVNFSPALFQTSGLQTITLTHGEIDLTNTSGTTTLTGPGASMLEVSGNSTGRVFGIDLNVTATISGITIADGKATLGVDGRYDGGGIYNQGSLTLMDSTLTGNVANGETGMTNAGGRGGGINTTGTLNVQNSTFSSNIAMGYGANSSSVGFSGEGGAIYGTSSGAVTISGSTLTGNSATGGSGTNGSGGQGVGGAIYAAATLNISSSTLSQNHAIGSSGTSTATPGAGGGGSGGAIFSATSATIASSTVTGNSASGGSGTYSSVYGGASGGGAYGGGIFSTGSLTITSSTVSLNTATSGIASLGSGTQAAGGGIYSTSNTSTGIDLFTLTQSTVSGNTAIGARSYGDSGAGSDALGGGVFASVATVSASTISGNGATGGVGNSSDKGPPFFAGPGGGAYGGGIWVNGASTLTDSTVANNTATGGAGGSAAAGAPPGETSAGSGGAAMAGGIDATAALNVLDSTVSGNSTVSGAGGAGYTSYNPQFDIAPGINGTASAGGLSVTGNSTLLDNTIVSANNAGGAFSDIAGNLHSTSSNNLIGVGGGLINGTDGNQIAINDPGLSSLGNNGGPTQTQILLPTSPAIGAGSITLIPNGITTDQRGFARLVNGKVDIGAVEHSPSVIVVTPPTSQDVDENVSTSVNLGSFTDSGTGPFTVSVNWGDGSPVTSFPVATVGSIPAQAHAFVGTGVLTVGITVVDASGGIGASSFSISSVATASMSITSSTSPSPTGAPVDFAATVAGTGPTPTGSVTFFDGSTQLSPAVVLTNGVAMFSTSSLAAGTHIITADYSGDSNYASTNSSSLTQGVVTQDLSATLAGSMPASVIATTPLKLKEKVTLAAGSAAITGTGTATLLLSPDDTAAISVLTLASGGGRLKLKVGKEKVFNLKVAKTIPASIPAGSYHVFIRLSDTAGNVAFLDAHQTLNVVAPIVDITGSFVKVPASVKAGRRFPITLLITNSTAANVPAVGVLPFELETSPDGLLSDAVLLKPGSRRINLKPGKSIRIAVTGTISSSTFLAMTLDPGQKVFGNDINPANSSFATMTQITVA